MSLFKYFEKVPKTDLGIAAAESTLTAREAECVEVAIASSSKENHSKPSGAKRQKYGDYDEFKRLEVAKWAVINGVRPASRKYNIPESTIRGMIKSLDVKKQDCSQDDLNSLPKKRRGAKPLLPEEIDEKVMKMIKSMRASGTGVTWDMTISIAKGLVIANDRTLLKENGGSLELNETWAQSIHRRLGSVKRKSTTTKQPVSPGLIKEIGFIFFKAVNDAVSAYNIPAELIINIDQTPLPFFLVSNYTLAEKGVKTVAVTNSGDYRQITGTFAVTMKGDFLPMQLIYQGKTKRCHPKVEFPQGFNVTQSPNHWSNEEKCKEQINEVLIPYVINARKNLNLRNNQEWLLIADVFKGHWTDDVKKLVNDSHGKMVAVPNNMTNIFQPLDLSVNRSCKAHLRKSTHDWFTSKVTEQLQKGVAPENVKVELKLSILKPLHAKWVISFYDFMLNDDKNIVKNGWKRSGLIDFLEKPSEEKQEDPFL